MKYTHDGVTLTATQWASRLGISRSKMFVRIRNWGVDDPRTFSPVKRRGGARPGKYAASADLTHDGETLTVAQWADRVGIGLTAMQRRLNKWGEGDPRTFATADTVRRDAVRRAADSRTKRFTWDGRTMTAEEWGDELGIGGEQVRRRVAKYGVCEQAFLPGDQGCAAMLYTHGGESMTASEWADRLGISKSRFHMRIAQFGEDSDIAYHEGHLKRGRRRSNDERLADVEIARGVGVDMQHGEEREARAEVIDMYLDEFPGFGGDRDAYWSVVDSIVRVLGRLSMVEVAQVLGTQRQRVDQIEAIALKKLRLAGGELLRESWDHSESRDRGQSQWESMLPDLM